MAARLVGEAGRRDDAVRDATAFLRRSIGLRVLLFNRRRLFMQWTTPTATDLRFGFEITLYIAAR